MASLGIPVPHHDQVNVAACLGRTFFGATEQVGGLHPEALGIHATRQTLREPLPPAPVFRCCAQPFTAELPLFPLEIFANSMRDVVEQLSLFLEKRAFPRLGSR